nr:tetratricopeptide repeat protein [Oceanococcus sp. HetDA_MAG_MS8]
MSRHISTWAPCAALLLASCAAQYDAADQENLDTLMRQEAPSLGDLLAQQEQVVSAREEAEQALPELSLDTPERPAELDADAPQADRGVTEALKQYRAILELAPNDQQLRFETQRRLADLQVEASELDPTLEASGAVSQSEAVSLYNGLLDARPNAPDNDRILYQLARAYQNLGELELAIKTLGELTRDFPGSRLNLDAHFRRAELLFKTRQYEEAGEEYRTVMQSPAGSSFFEQAQYKYGWSLYKQDRYRESLEVFVSILDRELPVGAVENLEATLEVIPRAQRELVRDVLRVVALAFSQIGGGPALTEFLGEREPRSYEPVLYANLAELFIDKERINDAAAAFYGLAERSPNHPLAPVYAAKVVDLYDKAGFDQQVIIAKERYVATYALNQPFWTANTPESSAEAYAVLVDTTRELGRHYQALAENGSGAAAISDYRRAADYFAAYVQDFPDAPERTEIRYNWADSLFAANAVAAAAQQFDYIVRNHPTHPRAEESAYALVLARTSQLEQAAVEERNLRLDDLVQASLDLQARFPEHPQVAAVLTRSAEELAQADRADEAMNIARGVLSLEPRASSELRLTNWRIIAYAHYDAQRYAEAEQAFADWLAELPPEAPGRVTLMEAQANSIYKQAVAAREAGDLQLAAATFQRVKQAWPGSALAADADFDAAAAYLQDKAWDQAVTALLAFREAYPQHRLQLEATRRLAAAYLETGDEVAAARELERIAATTTLAATVRKDALWQAATLYDKNSVNDAARSTYGRYFREHGSSNGSRQVKALERMLELTAVGNPDRGYWLDAAISLASTIQPGPRADTVRLLAANASLEKAEDQFQSFNRLRLAQPLDRTLSRKKAAMDRALRAYRGVLDYGFVDSSTQATFRIGEMYYQLARELMDLPPPAGLDMLEAEQYTLLLEEQAFPLEELSAEAHEANAARLAEGIDNTWIQRSLAQLRTILPARFGKTELVEEVYDELR